MTEAQKWQKRFERERQARKEAEKLLEEKSAELYTLNQSLEQKVNQEVEKNAQKERLLFQQSKMAAMGEMISNIAHQWRQPLQSISVLTQKLQIVKMVEGEITNDHLEDMTTKVSEQLEYLTKTIDDFRDFFKPNKTMSTFSLEHAINKALSIIGSTVKNKHMNIYMDLQEVQLESILNEFIQVLLNLIKNAIDILEEKNLEYKLIKIESFIENDTLFLKITDNAGGVPNDLKEKIFEPYFTTKHQSRGTGLGLYMSHEIIVKHMQGDLYVENITYEYEENEYTGASFIITLPINVHQ